MLARVPHGHAQPLVPAIRKRRQRRVERGAEPGDQRWQGGAEVLVLTASEPVTAHHQAGAEQRIVRVPAADHPALTPPENAAEARAAVLVDSLRRGPPIRSLQPLTDDPRAAR